MEKLKEIKRVGQEKLREFKQEVDKVIEKMKDVMTERGFIPTVNYGLGAVGASVMAGGYAATEPKGASFLAVIGIGCAVKLYLTGRRAGKEGKQELTEFLPYSEEDFLSPEELKIVQEKLDKSGLTKQNNKVQTKPKESEKGV